jgi:hypothetical protein
MYSEAAQKKVPSYFIWTVVIICILPFTLNLLGIDFGTGGTGITNIEELVPHSPGEVTDILHYSLAGSFVHTILEWSAFCTAIFTVLLSFIHFRITRDVATPIIGVALFCAGCMDAFHTLAADRLIEAVANNRNLIPFTWAICRLFNALIMIVGVSIFLLKKSDVKIEADFRFIIITSLIFGGIAYGIINYCATSAILPETIFPDSIITRPWDVAPFVLFIFAGAYVFPRFYKKVPTVFSHASCRQRFTANNDSISRGVRVNRPF